jgi:SAM-dependent methyltransferase
MNQIELYAQTGVAMTCRSYQEYEQMFMLDQDLISKGLVLDVASGASSFTAELNRRGYSAVAVDPLYRLSSEEIGELGQTEINTAIRKLSEKENLFVWDYYDSLENHLKIRNHSLNHFLKAYERDINKEKYIPAELPSIPFGNDVFSLVLCNHFLFLYQEQFDYQFHLNAIEELIRVTKKGGTICIYPLVGFKDEVYPELNELIKSLNKNGVTAEMVETKFRFLPSATHFLKINK